jgi:transcriptional regulator with XRE-family HTH domain
MSETIVETERTKSAYALEIGRRLKLARRRAGLDQSEVIAEVNRVLGASLGVGTYGHYEAGWTVIPTRMLIVVSKILGMPVPWFLGLPDPAALDDDERHLLEVFRSIESPDIRALLLRVAEAQARTDLSTRRLLDGDTGPTG